MQPDAAVSIVIPAYNYARYLERAARSALAQTFRPIEVIILDDGSTDETPGIARRLAAESPLVRHVRQENAGLSAARNSGIREARHPFIGFLDADDEWHPEMLAVIMAAYVAQPPDTGLVACDSYRIDPEGNPLGEKRIAPRGDRSYSAAEILMKTRFMPSCAVARREVFAEAGLFDTELRSSEDRDMWARIAMCRRVWFVERKLVRIRKHGANMSAHADRMLANMRRVRSKAMRAGVAPRSDAGYWMRLLALEHFQASWMYWDERRAGRAFLHALASMLWWPLPLGHRDLHEPPFFRLRAALRFLMPRPAR